MPLHVGHLYARFVVAGSVVAISRLMAEVFTADAIALVHDAAGAPVATGRPAGAGADGGGGSRALDGGRLLQRIVRSRFDLCT
jgi:hypothetical protein